jgi:signal peptidase II
VPAAADEAPAAPAVDAETAVDVGRSLRLAGLLALALVALDQASKQWALSALADGPVDLVGSLRFNLAFNSGTAFSMGRGWGGVISLVGLVVVVGLLRGVLQWPGRLPIVASGMVAGGAVGNLLDRVFRAGDGFLGGSVVDFIDVQWWPIFNVADIGICVGAGLLAILSFTAPEP